MNKILSAEDIHKTYFLKNEDINVLQGINLEVNRGDFVVILGPSGSGKSTLLNILGSLDHPTRGRIRFDGQDLFEHHDQELSRIRNAKIGFVFQFHHLLSEFTAQENIALPALERGVKSHDAYARAGDLLEKFGMADKRKRFPDELSGGERQRVAVARALVNEPLLILADEPTGNLDSANTAKLLDVFVRLKEENRTIVLVTHSLDIAKLGTNVYNLKEGRLI
jgi:ABC-type lipoprotein export system ATPase subunit